ncbi:2,3-bisphosphoglycerate-independent phosphoglycerate mutase [Candidatus Woesearchaeota archaeon]|nr:2,3-bisphosphoglycerate-independent phosphoglycerate mutase [Candidatus Woesearchaeota archaeon]
MDRVLLLILDGWGIRTKKEGNAIALAKTPILDSLSRRWPTARLSASGTAVGLPKGVMGNSEVGHLTIGAGRIVDTDLKRINDSISSKAFFKNKVLLDAIRSAKRRREKLHLLGLLSDAGVHSHITHLFALLEMAKREGVCEVYVHLFLDGRDTPPQSAEKYIRQLQQKMSRLGVGQIATMMGRYYAMDRDNRWAREHKAYDCMVNCKGRKRTDPINALHEAYAHGETDEFVKPTIFTNKCVVDKNDSVIFYNFRSDRARELTRAFVWGKFNQFQRKKIIGLHFVSLTQYDSLVKIPVAFPPIVPKQTLGEVISRAGLSQLRLAETEKWAHVTYFLNGLCECIFPHEKRIHVPSRKVTTYDKTPEMKVSQITTKLLQNLDEHSFFVVNFANGDMVGHTGNIRKTITAVEAVDRAIGRLVDAFPGKILITADHGNCEEMVGSVVTSHTTNDVPLIGVGVTRKLRKGGLADIAPTILELMELKKPKEMTGKSLLAH